MTELLNVDGIDTFYGRSQVLFGMSLSIKAGEVVTLMGRNGMGKNHYDPLDHGPDACGQGQDPLPR